MTRARTQQVSIKTAKRRANFQSQRSLPLWMPLRVLLVGVGLPKRCDDSEDEVTIVYIYCCWDDGEQNLKGGRGIEGSQFSCSVFCIAA